MSGDRSAREWRAAPSSLALAMMALVGLAPILHLVMIAAGVGGGGSPEGSTVAPFLDARALGLFCRSMAIGVGATLLALVPGLLCGLVLARAPLRGLGLIRTGLFALFCVSPYVLALGWSRALGGLAGSGARPGGLVATLLALAAAHLPLVALGVAFAVRRLPVLLEEAALLARGPVATITTVLVPSIAGTLGVLALLVFDLSFADYAVPSLLQVPTYPVEVFLYYSGSFQPQEAARACLPLVAVGLVVALALGGALSALRVTRTPAGARPDWAPSPGVRGASWVFLALGIGALVGPALFALALALPGPEPMMRALVGGGSAIGHSLGLSMLTALVVTGLGILAMEALGRLSGAALAGMTAALLAPQLVPASAYAIAWVELTARLGGAGRLLADGIGGPTACLVARFFGPAVLLLAAARRAIPREALDAATLQEGRRGRRFVVILLPQLLPALLMVVGGVAALSLNTVGVLVLTVPPGFDVLPLRADNLLHYGRAGEAVTLAFGTAALAILLGTPAVLAPRLARRWSA